MADQKLTALTAATAVTADDVFYVVDDPGGTPMSKKVTAANLKAYADEIRNWVSLGNLGATETVTGVDDQLYRAYGTLDQNCTVTVSLAADQQVDLLLVQDGTGGRTVTFSGVDAWSGRTPDLTGRAALAVDRFYFEDINGTTYGFWLTDDLTGISQSLVNAKGDLIVATADNTVTRLGVGANGQVLKAASGESSGLQWAGQSEVIVIAVGDETTTLTTGDGKVTFRMPFAMTLTGVRASLTTASSSGTPTVSIREGGVDILSTALTIDANELTSTTADVPVVISDSALADDAEIKIDVDVAGTGAAGLKVTLIGTRA